MGTPHHGTGQYISKGMMYEVIGAGLHVEKSVLKALSYGNGVLVDVVTEFTSLCSDENVRLDMCCIIEQRSTRVGQILGTSDQKVRRDLSAHVCFCQG